MSNPVNSRIPIAVVGTGWVATHRHLPILRVDKRFRLVGVIDHRADRVAAMAKQFGPNKAVAVGLDKEPRLDGVEPGLSRMEARGTVSP